MYYCPYYRGFSTNDTRETETPGQKPMNYVGSFLTQISNNTSTTGADITTASVPLRPLIKVVVDKNVVNDNVWANNQKAVTMQTSAGVSVPVQVSRIPDTVNFAERTNIFITPVNDLLPGERYRIIISPNLLAKNLFSTLGMTTNNQPVTVNFTTAGAAIVPVAGVTLNKTSMVISAGQTGTLTASISPANATNKAVTWSSSNTAVAAVNQSGVVTGVSPGTAVITVRTVSGAKTASSTVTVTAAQVIYTVKAGDTLYRISQIYALAPNDLIIANNLSAASYLYIGQRLIIPTIIYTVQSGDTLYRIALRYGTTIGAIINANNLSTAGNIYVGQRLFIPVHLFIYTVKAGDTLYAVAQRYATTVSNLARLNNLDITKPLFIGQRLKINY